MKTYFVTSDIHSFYNLFHKALIEKGFDINNKDHILIICGDVFDRGNESKELLDFIYDLYKQDRLIYIKGNHEDLLEECLYQIENKLNISSYHWYNRTVNTIEQLTGINRYDLVSGTYNYKKDIKPKFKKYFGIPKLDYYRLNNYLFVHGWVPEKLLLLADINNMSEGDWHEARWTNGIKAWEEGKTYKDITIVCGHWHTNEANKKYHNLGSGKFDEYGDFSPFKDTGIIDLDACTAFSNQVNIEVITV